MLEKIIIDGIPQYNGVYFFSQRSMFNLKEALYLFPASMYNLNHLVRKFDAANSYHMIIEPALMSQCCN